MGRHVARCIRDRLAGRAVRSFRYLDSGQLATIGRMAAVVDLRGLRLWGAPAWWFWLLAHVYFLIGFRNRLSVMLSWTWSYWTYQRSARIIASSGAADAQRRASGPPA
jgi:NADH dehydrogenase